MTDAGHCAWRVGPAAIDGADCDRRFDDAHACVERVALGVARSPFSQRPHDLRGLFDGADAGATMAASRQVRGLAPDENFHEKVTGLAVHHIKSRRLADDDVIHRLPMGDEIARPVAAAAVATALIVAHRAAHRRFLALPNYSARHDVATQLYARTL